MRQRLNYIRPGLRRLSVRRQCDLLTVNRSSLYYRPVDEKPENIDFLSGGNGNDEFVAEISTQKSSTKLGLLSLDVVTDFRAGDTVFFHTDGGRGEARSISDLDARDTADGVLVGYGDHGATILLAGVQLAQLSEAQFLFG